MGSSQKTVVVFVHGWSVTNLSTYGGLPLRLREAAKREGTDLILKEIFLGRYVSFHDEVRLQDVSRAFRAAVADQLSDVLKDGTRFACVTHSTGGPVVRDWWNTYHRGGSAPCPMSHLIMLAPANHGSALAQLGKGRIGRLKSWFEGVEPGQGVLDWLELGSGESWQLNKEWIFEGEGHIGGDGIFPFVLTGQSIDRKFYDSLNTYTGEIGSDGVVRVAAANLNARYIRLVQPKPERDRDGNPASDDFILEEFREAPSTAFRILSKKSHSGREMGVMASIQRDPKRDRETVGAIMNCIRVRTREEYDALCGKFDAETKSVQEKERVEIEDRMLLADRVFIHDRFSMVIFKVKDTAGRPVTDFDLILTAGERDDPNHFPEGFSPDRQRNRVHPNTITYYFDYDLIGGSADAVHPKDGTPVRKQTKGIDRLGIRIHPRPDKGFVRYIPCKMKANEDLFKKMLNPNGTTLVDIRLQRVVDKEVFRLEKLEGDAASKTDFKNVKPGNEAA